MPYLTKKARDISSCHPYYIISVRGLRYVRLPKHVKGFENSASTLDILLAVPTYRSKCAETALCKRTSFQMISFKENEADWRRS